MFYVICRGRTPPERHFPLQSEALRVFIASFALLEDWLRIGLIAAGLIPFMICVCFAIRIEQKAGWYECAKCGHKYVPAYKSVLFAMHVNRTRYMECPECGEKSWQKKRISKR